MPRKMSLLFTSVAVFGVSVVTFATTRQSDQEPNFGQDIQAVGSAIERAGNADWTQQVAASRQALNSLREHAATDAEAAAAAGMLDLALQREGFRNQPLESVFDKIANAADEASREEAWQAFENEIHDRANHLLKSFERGEIDVEEAKRLLDIAKYASTLIDDANDANPITGGDSRLTKMIKLLHGIAGGTEGIETADASELMESFRDLAAALARKVSGAPLTNAAEAFEIPAAVSAAIIDHNRRGLEAITETLNFLPAAMDGDPQALQDMLASSRRVEEIITGHAYGRAIWDAMNGRIIDRIPFARTLANWFGNDVTEESIAIWVGNWQTDWNDVRITPAGQIVPTGSGLFARRGGRIFARYATDDTLGGTWDFRVIGISGTFEWKLTELDRFEGFRQETNHPKLRWDGHRIFEDQ